jgi:phage-related protein
MVRTLENRTPNPWAGGLFEMRLKGAEGIARVFFCTVVERRVVMLHAFVKKSQETPRNELDIARKRLLEIKRDNV